MFREEFTLIPLFCCSASVEIVKISEHFIYTSQITIECKNKYLSILFCTIKKKI